MRRANFFWGDLHEAQFASLKSSIETKYLIIGGGVAGLAAAYALLEAGKTDITIVEKYTIGSGSTGHSAGMLVCEPETASWSELVAHYGSTRARAYREAQVAALETITKIIKKEKIRCDLMEQELLVVAGNKKAQAHILADFGARKAMRVSADLLEGSLFKKEFVSDVFIFGERVRENISINPVLFVRGFAQYLKKRGVEIYENTPVINVQNGIAKTQFGEIAYRNIIKCMGVDSQSESIEKYLTTITITRKLAESELRTIGLADRDMFLDDEQRSYHYGKITGDSRLLVGYGDIKSDSLYEYGYVHEPHAQNIKRFLKRAFPNISIPIEYAWSAEYALSKDDLPHITVSKHEGAVSGAGTQLASFVAATYVVDKMLRKEHVLDALFSNN